jgi:hypothetical protein
VTVGVDQVQFGVIQVCWQAFQVTAFLPVCLSIIGFPAKD